MHFILARILLIFLRNVESMSLEVPMIVQVADKIECFVSLVIGSCQKETFSLHGFNQQHIAGYSAVHTLSCINVIQ